MGNFLSGFRRPEEGWPVLEPLPKYQLLYQLIGWYGFSLSLQGLTSLALGWLAPIDSDLLVPMLLSFATIMSMSMISRWLCYNASVWLAPVYILLMVLYTIYLAIICGAPLIFALFIRTTITEWFRLAILTVWSLRQDDQMYRLLL